jgi:hypothetical protein
LQPNFTHLKCKGRWRPSLPVFVVHQAQRHEQSSDVCPDRYSGAGILPSHNPATLLLWKNEIKDLVFARMDNLLKCHS